MAEVHVVHVAFLRILIDSLVEAGINVQRYLWRSDLKNFNLDDPNSFVPIAATSEFYELIAQHETGSSLPPEIYDRYTIESMGGWSNYVHSAPDLLTAINNVAKPGARTFSSEVFKLEVRDKRARIADSIAWKPSLVRDWNNSLALALAVNGARIYLGEDWTPDLTLLTPQAVTGIEDYFDTPITFDTEGPSFGIEFSTDLLSSIAVDNPNALDELSVLSMPSTTTRRVEAILETWRFDQTRSLQRIADVAGISARSLQRSLNCEGVSFTDVLESWRVKTALDLLSDDHVSVLEISQRLGYAQDVNFIRAFQRWTGTTPLKYRQLAPNESVMAAK
jgi:AraC-like DNA-binding protein